MMSSAALLLVLHLLLLHSASDHCKMQTVTDESRVHGQTSALAAAVRAGLFPEMPRYGSNLLESLLIDTTDMQLPIGSLPNRQPSISPSLPEATSSLPSSFQAQTETARSALDNDRRLGQCSCEKNKESWQEKYEVSINYC